jgi:hypothetical protein
MDLLRYPETILTVCFKDKTRQEIYDNLRLISVYRDRVRVCPCVKEPWVRQSLVFLDAQLNNEPSHQPNGSG